MNKNNNCWLNISPANQGINTNCAPFAGIFQSTVSVKSTNTVEPNTPASVINEGTVCNAELVFNIPSGSNGEDGEPGKSPFIGPDNYWYQWDDETEEYYNTNIKATGANGVSATVDAGVATSLPYGSSPTVSNSGTNTNAIFNFGIPSGKPGKQIVTAETTSVDIPTGDYINTITYDDGTTDTFKSPKGPSGNSGFIGSAMIKAQHNSTTPVGNNIVLSTISNFGTTIASLSSNSIILNKGLYNINLSFNANCVQGQNVPDEIIMSISVNGAIINTFAGFTNGCGNSKLSDEIYLSIQSDNSIVKIINSSKYGLVAEMFKESAPNVCITKTM